MSQDQWQGLSLSHFTHFSDPKAAERCHTEHPAAFIPSLTEL